MLTGSAPSDGIGSNASRIVAEATHGINGSLAEATDEKNDAESVFAAAESTPLSASYLCTPTGNRLNLVAHANAHNQNEIAVGTLLLVRMMRF
eukprot:SAG31_NODE_19319_length_606_cov_0.812623_1_plen_92_part_01